MKVNRITRRMFLQGAGKAAFAVPFAGSLFKSTPAMAETAAPLRFIYMGMDHGSNLNMRVPELSVGKWNSSGVNGDGSFLTTDTSLGIRSGVLPSNLALAGSAFDFLNSMSAVKQQLLIVNGLSASDWVNGHQQSNGTGGSMALTGNVSSTSASVSIDQVLASKIYTTPPTVRSLLLAPTGTYGLYKFSADSNNTLLSHREIQDAFNTDLMNGGLFPTGTGPSPLELRKQRAAKSAIDFFKEDRIRLQSNSRLSTDDKSRLDEYLSLIRDLEVKYAQPPQPPGCQSYSLSASDDTQEMMAMIKACFLCDITRIVGVGGAQSPTAIDALANQIIAEVGGTNNNHDLWHASFGAKAAMPAHIGILQRAAALAGILASTPDTVPGQNMLENTMIVVCHENGGIKDIDINSHYSNDVSYVIFGGSNFLNTGRMVDGSDGQRFPIGGIDGSLYTINSFLITLMTAMGLTPNDWESSGVQGFGSYGNSTIYRQVTDGSAYGGTKELKLRTGRRTLVPGILKS